MTKMVKFQIRCHDFERRDWHDQAKAAGLTVSDWIRRKLNVPLSNPTAPPEGVMTAPGPKILCSRCQRIGSPSCPICRHLFLGDPLPVTVPEST